MSTTFLPAATSRTWLRAGTGVLVCFAAAVATLPLGAAAAPCARLAGWIRTEMDRQDVPSMAFAIARDGRIVCEDAFGWADYERRIAATPSTRYSLASISKPITATGLMRLVDQGLVDLDAPANAYLDDAALVVRAGRAEEATVRRLANHTSGLPLHHHFFVEGESRPPAMEETIRRYGDAVFAPGQRYQYSNLGYGVLDHIIARRSGRTYADFMKDEIFQPLGMRRTSVGIPVAERDDYAIRYASGRTPLPYYDFDHRGASAVFSTAHDLAMFGLFHAGRPHAGSSPVLSRSSVRQMQRPSVQNGHGSHYAIGWQIDSHASGHVTVSHTGGMPGVSTALTLVPTSGLVVVALANAATPLPQRTVDRALADLLPRRSLVSPGARAASSSRVPTPARRVPARQLLGTWEGSVRAGDLTIPIDLRIEPGGDAFVRLAGREAVRLVVLSPSGSALRGILTSGRLETEDAARRSHGLQIDVIRQGETLEGSLTAIASSERDIGFALSHWVQFRRVPPAQ